MPNRKELEATLNEKHAWLQRNMIRVGGQLDGVVALGNKFKVKDSQRPSVLMASGISASESTVSTSPIVVLGDGRFSHPRIGMVEKTLTPRKGALDIVRYRTTMKDVSETVIDAIHNSDDLHPVSWLKGAVIVDDTPDLYRLEDIKKPLVRARLIEEWIGRMQIFARIAEDFNEAARDTVLNPSFSEHL